MPDSPQCLSFVEDAVEWRRSGSQETLLRLLRSPYSGVPHDVAAAYATVAQRSGALLEAIDRGRLALPPAERDTVLRFSQRARRIAAVAPEFDDEKLRQIVAATFELSSGPISGRYDGAPSDAAPAAIALADPVAPEEPSPVAGWQRHLSPSALNLYAECARRWFYRYVCAAIEDPGSSASSYGKALHLALEDFHADFPRPGESAEGAMRRRIRECVTWAFERNRDGFDTAVEFLIQGRRAQRTAQRYVNWLLSQTQVAPFEVLGREVAASLDLDGRAFIGFIDRLDRDERTGGISVVDYKTGSIALTAAEYSQKVRRFRDFQLPFYYWARTAAGDRVTKLVLVPLKDALLEVRPISLEVVEQSGPPLRDNGSASGTIAREDLERSSAQMVALSDRLASGETARFEVTAESAVCGYCNYATACAQRRPAEGRRFGS